jgi:hypothetical protein
MSTILIHRALNQKLPPTAKLLLVVLAQMADFQDRCNPTMDYLAARCGICRMTVYYAVMHLEEADLLEVTRIPGNSKPNDYRLKLTGDA